MHPQNREATYMARTRTLRIFLSHAREDIAVAQATAAALSNLGLTPFMAARHIRPAREWLPRLERELTASDALAAFLTPAFRTSAWADQEVGYALAKGKKVLPIQLELMSAPHGFIERYQAVQASNMTPHDIALSIFDWLLSYDDARQELKYLVISNLRNDRSEAGLRLWITRLMQLSKASTADIAAILAAAEANSMIATNPSLRNDIQSIIERLPKETEP